MIRYAFLLIFITVFLVGANGCASFGEHGDTQPAQESGETRVYEVFGMGCPGCHGGLEKLVMKLPAVQRAEANWKDQQLTVVVKPEHQLRDEDIHDAIKRANFTVGRRIQ
jgi:copper chaperone CopZ